MIAECVASLECEVFEVKTYDDGSLLVFGNVVVCWASPAFFVDGFYTFDEKTPADDLTLHHYGQNHFGVSTKFC